MQSSNKDPNVKITRGHNEPWKSSKSKGESNMFNNQDIRESTLKRLMGAAIDAEDWKLVKELRQIENETDQRAFEERMNGIIVGLGAAITCVIVGGVVTKVIISMRKE